MKPLSAWMVAAVTLSLSGCASPSPKKPGSASRAFSPALFCMPRALSMSYTPPGSPNDEANKKIYFANYYDAWLDAR